MSGCRRMYEIGVSRKQLGLTYVCGADSSRPEPRGGDELGEVRGGRAEYRGAASGCRPREEELVTVRLCPTATLSRRVRRP